MDGLQMYGVVLCVGEFRYRKDSYSPRSPWIHSEPSEEIVAAFKSKDRALEEAEELDKANAKRIRQWQESGSQRYETRRHSTFEVILIDVMPAVPVA